MVKRAVTTSPWRGLRERVLRSVGLGAVYDMLGTARRDLVSTREDLAAAHAESANLSAQLEDLRRQFTEVSNTYALARNWPAIDQCLLLHLTPADVVFDIGANQGVYTRLCAGVARHVHAFEPHPVLFPRLQATHQQPNVTLVNKAVTDRVGTAEFNMDTRPDMNAVASSLLELSDLKAKGLIEKVRVEATTVDRYCEESGAVPTLVKIDVEGAEPLVIAGAAETIRRHRPKIVFEFWETHWPRFEPTFTALERAGYYLVRVADGADASRHYRAGSYEGGADIMALPLDQAS